MGQVELERRDRNETLVDRLEVGDQPTTVLLDSDAVRLELLGRGGIGAGGSGVVPTSSYTRPVGSFSTPNAPKLPGGFGGAIEPVATGPSPSGGAGTGGLYGAPASAMGRDGAAATEQRQGRTMQVTLARSAADRGDR